MTSVPVDCLVTVLVKWDQISNKELGQVINKWASAVRIHASEKNASYSVTSHVHKESIAPFVKRSEGDLLLYEDTVTPSKLWPLLDQLVSDPVCGHIEGWNDEEEKWWPNRFVWLLEWRVATPAARGVSGHALALHMRSSAVKSLFPLARESLVGLLTKADSTKPIGNGLIDIAPPHETADGLHYLHRRQGTLCREMNQWWAWSNRARLSQVALGIGWGTVLSKQLVDKCGGIEFLRAGIRSEGEYSHRTDLVELLPSGGCIALLSPSVEDPLVNSYSKPGSTLVLDWRGLAPRALWLRRLLSSVDAI